MWMGCRLHQSNAMQRKCSHQKVQFAKGNTILNCFSFCLFVFSIYKQNPPMQIKTNKQKTKAKNKQKQKTKKRGVECSNTPGRDELSHHLTQKAVPMGMGRRREDEGTASHLAMVPSLPTPQKIPLFHWSSWILQPQQSHCFPGSPDYDESYFWIV